MKGYRERHELRGRVDDEVWERLQFFKKELKKRGKKENLNNVLRLLMIEAGWVKEKRWIEDL